MLNQTPDGRAVLRFVCQTKPMDSNTYLLKLDQLRLDMPPAAEPGWHEFEDMSAPIATGQIAVRLPKYGRFDWCGWGALALSGRPGGKAVLRTMVAVAHGSATHLRLRASLGPGQGAWQVCVAGAQAVTLTPANKADYLVEWTVPLGDLKLPGPIELAIVCTAPGKQAPRQHQAPDVELTLDGAVSSQSSRLGKAILPVHGPAALRCARLPRIRGRPRTVPGKAGRDAHTGELGRHHDTHVLNGWSQARGLPRRLHSVVLRLLVSWGCRAHGFRPPACPENDMRSGREWHISAPRRGRLPLSQMRHSSPSPAVRNLPKASP